jgi:multidrug efflux pump subunit AcrA (membrane-fusion protein)
MRPLRTVTTGLLPAALGLALLPGCRDQASGDSAGGAAAVKARVVTVEPKKLRRDVESVGSLVAYEETVVSSEVEGRVEKILADVGDRVARGQPLVRVAPRELELGLEQQRGALGQVRARLGLPDGADDLAAPGEAATVKRAAADLEDAEQKHRRARSLLEDGLISRGAYDEAEARYKAAQAAHEVALQEVENLRAEMREQRAGVALAEKKLSDTLIRAPFAGHVKERQVALGQYLRVQTPVMVLVNTDPLRVRLRVPEKAAAWVEVGQEVRVRVEAWPERTFTGSVSRLSPAVDTETRTLEVEALLENGEGLLKPGFFVKAAIASKRVDQVIQIPHEAVRYVFGVYKIFAVEGKALKEREVKLGERSGDEVEIVEGLAARERVAIPLDGQEPRDGATVEAVQ